MARVKTSFSQCLWHFVLAGLVTCGVQIAGSAIIGAVLNEFSIQLLINLIYEVFTMTVFAVSFYRFHQYPRISTYMEHPRELDMKGELLAYIRAEGKYLFIFFGVCAVLRVVFNYIAASFISLVGIIFIDTVTTSIGTQLHLPAVLSALIALIDACAMVCGLALLRSRKIHEEDRLARRR